MLQPRNKVSRPTSSVMSSACRNWNIICDAERTGVGAKLPIFGAISKRIKQPYGIPDNKCSRQIKASYT